MNNKKEDWKDIPEFEGYYEVSSFGRIRSIARTTIGPTGRKYRVKQKILKGSTRNGNAVLLHGQYGKKAFRVSRLVWSVFVGSIPDDCFVIHKNGNELDDSLENLMIGDQSLVEKMKISRGTAFNPKGKRVLELQFRTGFAGQVAGFLS